MCESDVPKKDHRWGSLLLLFYNLSEKLAFTTNRCVRNSCKAPHAPEFPVQEWAKELPLSNLEKKSLSAVNVFEVHLESPEYKFAFV